MKLGIHVLGLLKPWESIGPTNPDPSATRKFTIQAKEDATFGDVWTQIEQRFRENYVDGQKDDWAIKKLTTKSGDDDYDIDTRDTVADVFEATSDLNARVVRVHRIHVDRASSIPIGSHLHVNRTPPSKEQARAAKRRQIEQERYGHPLEHLSPNHPVQSREVDTQSLQAPLRRDSQGFAIPALPPSGLRATPRATRPSDVVPASPLSTQSGRKSRTLASSTRSPPQAEVRNAQTTHARSVSRSSAGSGQSEHNTPTRVLQAVVIPNSQPDGPSAEATREADERDEQVTDSDSHSVHSEISSSVSDSASSSQPSQAPSPPRSPELGSPGLRISEPHSPESPVSRKAQHPPPSAQRRRIVDALRQSTTLPGQKQTPKLKKTISSPAAPPASGTPRTGAWTPSELYILQNALTLGKSAGVISSQDLLPGRTRKAIEHKLVELRRSVASKPSPTVRKSAASKTPQPASPSLRPPSSSYEQSVQSSPSTQLAARDPNWSKVDIKNIEISIKNNLLVPQIHHKYFQGRPRQEVMRKVSAIKKQLRAQQHEQGTADQRSESIQQENQTGRRSSSSSEKWTRDEDDLLLAARLEGMDMKRIANTHFPRRESKQVIGHANSIWHAVTGRAKRKFPNITDMKQAVLDTLNPKLLMHVRKQIVHIRLLDKPAFDKQRSDEHTELNGAVMAEEQDRFEKSQARIRLEHQRQSLSQQESDDRDHRQKSLQRTLQDYEADKSFDQQQRDWDLERAHAIASGEAIPPPPTRPPPSLIGLDIAITDTETLPTSAAHAKRFLDPANSRPSPSDDEISSDDQDVPNEPHTPAPRTIKSAASGSRLVSGNRKAFIIPPAKASPHDSGAQTTKSRSFSAASVHSEDSHAFKTPPSRNVATFQKQSPMSHAGSRNMVTDVGGVNGSTAGKSKKTLGSPLETPFSRSRPSTQPASADVAIEVESDDELAIIPRLSYSVSTDGAAAQLRSEINAATSPVKARTPAIAAISVSSNADTESEEEEEEDSEVEDSNSDLADINNNAHTLMKKTPTPTLPATEYIKQQIQKEASARSQQEAQAQQHWTKVNNRSSSQKTLTNGLGIANAGRAQPARISATEEDEESADEEIVRFDGPPDGLSTPQTPSRQRQIRSTPPDLDGSHGSLPRRSSQVLRTPPAATQSSLGSMRPPFPSSGKVKSTQGTQSPGLSARNELDVDLDNVAVQSPSKTRQPSSTPRKEQPTAGLLDADLTPPSVVRSSGSRTPGRRHAIRTDLEHMSQGQGTKRRRSSTATPISESGRGHRMTASPLAASGKTRPALAPTQKRPRLSSGAAGVPPTFQRRGSLLKAFAPNHHEAVFSATQPPERTTPVSIVEDITMGNRSDPLEPPPTKAKRKYAVRGWDELEEESRREAQKKQERLEKQRAIDQVKTHKERRVMRTMGVPVSPHESDSALSSSDADSDSD